MKTWGTAITGENLEEIPENQPLEVGQAIIFKGNVETQETFPPPSVPFDLLESQFISKTLANHELSNFTIKYIKIEMAREQWSPWNYVGHTEIHAVVKHASPISWSKVAGAIIAILYAIVVCKWFWIAIVAWLIIDYLPPPPENGGWLWILVVLGLIFGTVFLFTRRTGR